MSYFERGFDLYVLSVDFLENKIEEKINKKVQKLTRCSPPEAGSA
jgi:hypothetical protein